jgi:hypothetical protein
VNETYNHTNEALADGGTYQLYVEAAFNGTLLAIGIILGGDNIYSSNLDPAQIG